MFNGPEKQGFDPRSPVQHVGSNAGLFLLAVVMAIAIWTVQQVDVRDFISKPTSSSGERRSQAAARPQTQSQSEPAQRPTFPSPATARLGGLFTGDDYPPEALDANEQGTVVVRVEVDDQGRVSSCTIARSSGHASLDNATCRIVRSRARFSPARDRDGNPTPSSFTQTVKWVIAD